MATAVVKSPFDGHAVGDVLTGAEADAALSGPAARFLSRKADPVSAPLVPPRIELVVIEEFEGHPADTLITDAAVIEEIEQGPNAGKVRRVAVI